MFKVNTKDTKKNSVVLVSLLLTLNIFHTFALVFLSAGTKLSRI